MTDHEVMRHNLSLLNDEKLLSILRDQNADEWRPEVFGIVASILRDRGISPSLASDHESDREGEVPTEGAVHIPDLVAVASYLDGLDAETDRSRLGERGLRAWIFDGDMPSESSVELRVLPDDVAAALAILQSDPLAVAELPPETAEPPCPQCGDGDVIGDADSPEGDGASARPSGSISEQKWIYRCNACGHRWSES